MVLNPVNVFYTFLGCKGTKKVDIGQTNIDLIFISVKKILYMSKNYSATSVKRRKAVMASSLS